MKSSIAPLKYVIGRWTRPVTNSVHIKEKKREIWELPWNLRTSKGLFSRLCYPLSWSNKFCHEKGKMGSLATIDMQPWQRNVVLMYIYIFSLFIFSLANITLVRRKEGEKVKKKLMKNFQISLFGHMLKKVTEAFFGAWSLLLVHVWFTSSEGSQRL